MSDAVFVTGVGAISPLGHGPREMAECFCAGQSAVRRLDAGGADVFGATLADIPLEAMPAERRTHSGRLDRLCRVFLSAAYLANESAGLQPGDAEADRVGLSFGTGLGCLLTNAEYNQKLVEHGPSAASPRLFAYTVSSAAAGEVSIALGIKGANVTSHAGLAAGLQAIGYGIDLLHMGKADVVFAGGADVLGEALVHGLADMGLLKPRVAQPFGAPVAGVCPAEGAAVVILERAEHALRRGARRWGRVDGYAAGFEPTLARRNREPRAITETVRRALARSGYTAGEVDLVLTSAHGTALDAVELAALREVFGDGETPRICAPKAAWGETFGAHGALSVALATGLRSRPLPLADGVIFDLGGAALVGRGAGARAAAPRVVLVHALCYAGPTVALVLSLDD